jgi:hypothetical protein
MSESEKQAVLERLRAENARLKSKDQGSLTSKVSEKGRVSLYGMGRLPTLFDLAGRSAARVTLCLLTRNSERPASLAPMVKHPILITG